MSDQSGNCSRQPVRYYAADFSWESLRDKAQPLLAQLEAAAASNSASSSTAASAALAAADATEATAGAADATTATAGSWEVFHQQHASGRFFRPKRYLMAEFPRLTAPGLHILDIGAGNGASVLPILVANASARATCCDISTTALRLLRTAADGAGIAAERVVTVQLDASATDARLPLDALADVALLIFVLSAVPPQHMAAVLQLAHASLRPGGLLLFRDYALYDLPQLRFKPAAMLGCKNLFRREDDTLAYFFSVQDVQERAAAAGFAVLECSYACVNNENRKTGEILQRAFLHGVFRKE